MADGGYAQFRLLARSPYGLTYRCRAERLGGDVVLRIYPSDLGAPGPSELFIEEMRRLANFPRHGLVTPVEVGHTDVGAPYVTRRYVDGPSLGHLVALSSNDIDAWSRQVSWFGSRLSHAVSALHNNGVIHGSIRPSNVFVTSFGTLHITDVVPHTAVVMGMSGITRRSDHVAPEVLAGSPPSRDSDVFSMASVIRSLVGTDVLAHLPAPMNTLFEEALDARSGRRPPLDELMSAFDAALGADDSYQPVSQIALPAAPAQAALGPSAAQGAFHVPLSDLGGRSTSDVEMPSQVPGQMTIDDVAAEPPRSAVPGEAIPGDAGSASSGGRLGQLIRRLVRVRRRTDAEPPQPASR